MTLPDAQSEAIRKALAKVVHTATEAQSGPDLETIRKILNAVWFAVHDAQQLLNDTERQARDAALLALEQAA